MTQGKENICHVLELEGFILLKYLYHPNESIDLIQSLTKYPRHFSQN